MKEIDFDKTYEYFNFNAQLLKSIRMKERSKRLVGEDWKFINVVFSNNGVEYTYLTNLDCKVGNIVEAPTFNYSYKQQAMVVKIIDDKNWQPPVADNKLLVVSKILAENDTTGFFDREGFIERNIDEELIKEWQLDERGEYGENYISTFGIEIIFEFGEGYIECYIEGEEVAQDYYGIYNVDRTLDIETQVKYLETIISKLHYNIITKEQFEKLLDIL